MHSLRSHTYLYTNPPSLNPRSAPGLWFDSSSSCYWFPIPYSLFLCIVTVLLFLWVISSCAGPAEAVWPVRPWPDQFWPALWIIKTRKELVHKRLQHQRKSVHVEVPLYGIFYQLAIEVIYIYNKNYCIQCYSQRKKSTGGKNECLMNNLWGNILAAAWPLLFCFRRPCLCIV